MPCDCGLLCLLTDRRRYCEILWRRRFLITNDERKAKRRFLNLMRGFDTEDLRVLRKAVESFGLDIKQCAPGPPMDLVEEEDESDLLLRAQQASTSAAGCSTTVMSSRPRHSINRLERDRILFQRQKFPEVGGGVPPPSAGPYPPDYITHYRKNSRRKSSAGNFSRRYAYVVDDGVDQVLLEQSDATFRKQSQQQRFFGAGGDDDYENGEGGGLPYAQNEDLGLIPQIDRPMSMPYLCCKMWRWKDLQVDAALHRLDPLPWCRFGRVTINNATVSCCNPFHYGLWIRPEHSPSLTSADEPQLTTTSGILANGGGHLSGDYATSNDTGFGDGLTGDYGAKTTTTTATMMSGVGGAGPIGHVRSVFKSIEQHIKGGTGIDGPPGDDLPPAEPPPPVPPGGEDMSNHIPLHSSHYSSSASSAWGRMARWERKQRIGDVVALMGQFVAVGTLAGTVFDGQDVKSTWDLENHASFSLIKQTENENFEDIWLYNSGDRPLFICVSRSLSNSARTEAIRRLSPGYCIRVHRIPQRSIQIADVAALPPPTILSGGVDVAAAAASTTTLGITKSTATAATTTTLIGGGGGRMPIIATTTTTNARGGGDIDGGGGGLSKGASLRGGVARSPTTTAGASAVSGPSSIAFLTISVGLGWGINYQRLYVTDVPCRYEIIFT